MYSHELQGLINNGTMSRTDYLMHVDSTKSPQISHIAYKPFDDIFVVDTTDNYHLEFTIKKEA